MTVQYGNRRYFTTDGDLQGPGLGSVIGTMNTPMDAYFLDEPPGPYQDFDYNIRYIWSHEDQEWQMNPNAMPGTLPGDYWSWNWQPRYDVDPSDPLRNSWVIKEDAEPVDPPEPEPEDAE